MTLIEFKKNLTVVILCGGKGLRLRPLTNQLPKPLIKINDKSILENIISYFLSYNIKNIIIATGYKNNLINKFVKKKFKKNKIKLIYTGYNSDIIKRLEKTSEYSKNYLLACYGDTMVDIDLDKYIKFYLKKVNKITLASYQLKSNFGILEIDNNETIKKFNEKPTLDIWFNVGYIIFSNDKFKYFRKFSLFKNLLVFLSRKKIMRTYKHKGNHITVNTIEELEQAKRKIKKFNVTKKK
tara:strand:- start:635 stop:1351 length:717 start_codon:yes stop_codon:yes gene_type:complete